MGCFETAWLLESQRNKTANKCGLFRVFKIGAMPNTASALLTEESFLVPSKFFFVLTETWQEYYLTVMNKMIMISDLAVPQMLIQTP